MPITGLYTSSMTARECVFMLMTSVSEGLAATGQPLGSELKLEVETVRAGGGS